MSARVFSVWAEGHAATGGGGVAVLIAAQEARTFDEAVILYAESVDQKPIKRDGVWSLWGCRLFDNEQDARRSFG